MVVEIAVGALLKAVATGAIGSLSGKVTGAAWEKLKRDPAVTAFQRALARALELYGSTGQRLALAKPLLARRGPLSDEEVTAELGKVLRPDAAPDPAVIAAHWRAALDGPVSADLTAEAAILLGHLTAELREEEVFRPVFAQRSLEAIADSSEAGAEALQQLVENLANLTRLTGSGLAGLADAVRSVHPALSLHVRSWTRLINERTRGFVGRAFVFEAFEAFTGSNPCGYFLVLAKPGVGKTAIAAELVRRGGHVHHFNVRAEGVNRADMFLRSVCAQLVAAFGLPYTDLPPDAHRDAGFLSAVLDQVSERLADGERCVIVVDGLDEVETSDHEMANVLFLPTLLPPGVFVVATVRDGSPVPLRVDCARLPFRIDAGSAENLADIRAYVGSAAARAGGFMAARRLTSDGFVRLLTERSEGNFMYLRHVLPEVISGRYDDTRIPQGLENYYEDHWRLMRSGGRLEEQLPVLMALTTVDTPLTASAIAEFAGVPDPLRTVSLLAQWGQFLVADKTELDGRPRTRYRIYHQSFRDFLREKEEVGELTVTHRQALDRAADALWNRLQSHD
ncbi:P-loop NTPase family protein [Streptomyces hiroshimensis]|uniref:Nephrocystin 3-like N-terminal domain-containing protein n=1 Tax=Streptomyces hiroshimensis TaxID=66424 RepID=A0ABQ2Y6L7_9ACTN|nr:hypothetical protein [Streptomyces hiroshimensis]GGX66195.1 hypothetical protein GCM10010324_09110 [Streptomyces hiroshimensis]